MSIFLEIITKGVCNRWGADLGCCGTPYTFFSLKLVDLLFLSRSDFVGSGPEVATFL